MGQRDLNNILEPLEPLRVSEVNKASVHDNKHNRKYWLKLIKYFTHIVSFEVLLLKGIIPSEDVLSYKNKNKKMQLWHWRDGSLTKST